ncbi:MAG: hypothetical protein H8D23_39450 [Candidatus Brocadiales bacterium]|nr:hypothetical protein [Candidatus Brocadiales bacterium]
MPLIATPTWKEGIQDEVDFQGVATMVQIHGVDEGLLGGKGCSNCVRWICGGGDWLLKSRRRKNNNNKMSMNKHFIVLLNSCVFAGCVCLLLFFLFRLFYCFGLKNRR